MQANQTGNVTGEEMPEEAPDNRFWLIVLLLAMLLFLIPLLLLLRRKEPKDDKYTSIFSDIEEREVSDSAMERTSIPWFRWLVWLLLIGLIIWLIASLRPVGWTGFIDTNESMNISDDSLGNLSGDIRVNLTEKNITPVTTDGANISANITGASSLAQRFFLPQYWWLYLLVLLLLGYIIYRLFRREDAGDITVIDLKKRRKIAAGDEAKRYGPVFLIIFLLLLLLVGVLIFGRAFMQPAIPAENQTLNQTDYKTVFSWDKNREYRINLSEYTINADDDLIEYRVTPVENIGIEIDGSVVILTPDTDFVGDRVVNFIAIDSRGGRAYSPDILLRVRDREPVTVAIYRALKSALSNAINYVLLTLVLIVVVIILLILRVRDKKRMKVLRPKRKL
jgi:hypothetical protein